MAMVSAPPALVPVVCRYAVFLWLLSGFAGAFIVGAPRFSSPGGKHAAQLSGGYGETGRAAVVAREGLPRQTRCNAVGAAPAVAKDVAPEEEVSDVLGTYPLLRRSTNRVPAHRLRVELSQLLRSSPIGH